MTKCSGLFAILAISYAQRAHVALILQEPDPTCLCEWYHGF